ncbi:FAD-dependent tricarballylate dehydrogenase TcuA [Dactylosporangium sp. CA-092794]|uniref:FAD-dependent tricarballylate dehydrogenase TcuA n=1 Tax=Dactylosporangium sp. CA-092794 TaxID=3239929 RepID=UPI003D89CA3C
MDVTKPSVAPPEWTRPAWDVVVIGGGNAALAAGIAASDAGARVLILERAPKHLRGGNSRHTRNLRCVSVGDRLDSGSYGHDELWADLCGVGEGPNNEALARFTVEQSATLPAWMSAHGVRWQRPLTGTLHLGRTNRFFLGGGKAMLNAYYRYVADSASIEVVYDAMVEDFEITGTRCTGLTVLVDGVRHGVRASAVICASGGFEANIEWLRRYWGDAADNYVIRGTAYNDGHILARLYDAGAARAGQERGFHAICVDARAPRFDGGIATRLDSIPFGIVVNRDGRRFYDEGEELWPKRYAMWGSHVARQPGQIAYSLWDAKVRDLFLPPMYGAASANRVGDLAAELGLDPARLTRTVEDYNAAVVTGNFDPSGLDTCQTKGLAPPKSHWAQPLDTPPFFGVAIRPGITFTYMGVAVGADARIAREDGSMFDNLYAAGEIMSGNILSTGYLAGFGVTIGTVWGRHAGTNAAVRVHG